MAILNYLQIPLAWLLATIGLCGFVDSFVEWRCYVHWLGVLQTYLNVRDVLFGSPYMPLPSWVADYLVVNSAIVATLRLFAQREFQLTLLGLVGAHGAMVVPDDAKIYNSPFLFALNIIVIALASIIFLYIFLGYALGGAFGGRHLARSLLHSIVMVFAVALCAVLISSDIPYNILDIDVFLGVGRPSACAVSLS
jgi:hypothetical protein